MINPSLFWHEPQFLRSYPYVPDLDVVPKKGGVYIYYRVYGGLSDVFYVGRALNLRQRIKGQMNNLKLMNGIKAAAKGKRYLAYAEIVLRPGQTKSAAVNAAEKLLIRHFVDDGHNLMNIQGVKIKLQTLENQRPTALKSVVPIRTQIVAQR
ncbi:GIY-YIG nuclease family protein [Achromobacter sp. SIMBA_011]|uniref:GIY-YIG nuclease family protein n=2 Tax=Pseudomonadota TaxID=1224 RepID=UPI0012DACFDD|nr:MULTISPECIES: GIY-YIG nuclease family protein [Achromobacter]